MNTKKLSLRLILFIIGLSLPCQMHGASTHLEKTFAMIKPIAVQDGRDAQIIKMIQRAGFSIIAMKKIILTKGLINDLYRDCVLRAWFRKYVKSVVERPAVVMILEKEDAIRAWSKQKKIIRKLYGEYFSCNSVHGSDSIKDARREIAIFFPELQK